MDQAARAEKVSALPPPEEREAALERRLREFGISFVTHAHMPVFTVEEARAFRGALPGGRTKNLFLKDKKGKLWLVVLRENVRADLGALARSLRAARFSFGDAKALEDTLGVPPGSVTPFALINVRPSDIRVVLDEGMLALDPLNFHPLRNDRTTSIAAADLLHFVRSLGHEPIITTIPERTG